MSLPTVYSLTDDALKSSEDWSMPSFPKASGEVICPRKEEENLPLTSNMELLTNECKDSHIIDKHLGT